MQGTTGTAFSQSATNPNLQKLRDYCAQEKDNGIIEMVFTVSDNQDTPISEFYREAAAMLDHHQRGLSRSVSVAELEALGL